MLEGMARSVGNALVLPAGKLTRTSPLYASERDNVLRGGDQRVAAVFSLTEDFFVAETKIEKKRNYSIDRLSAVFHFVSFVTRNVEEFKFFLEISVDGVVAR